MSRHLLVHAGEGEVGAGQVALQVGEGRLHQALHVQPLLPARRGSGTNKNPGVRDKTNPGVSFKQIQLSQEIRWKLAYLVMPGDRPKPLMLRPTRILVDFTGAVGSMLPWRRRRRRRRREEEMRR